MNVTNDLLHTMTSRKFDPLGPESDDSVGQIVAGFA